MAGSRAGDTSREGIWNEATAPGYIFGLVTISTRGIRSGTRVTNFVQLRSAHLRRTFICHQRHLNP